MNNPVHPAVHAHEDAMKNTDECMLPNHDQLIPYLEQLPKNYVYKVFDIEDDAEDDYEAIPMHIGVGLEVKFDRKYGYGGCQMVQLDNGGFGLHVWYDGSDESSALPYWVLPVGVIA